MRLSKSKLPVSSQNAFLKAFDVYRGDYPLAFTHILKDDVTSAAGPLLAGRAMDVFHRDSFGQNSFFSTGSVYDPQIAVVAIGSAGLIEQNPAPFGAFR